MSTVVTIGNFDGVHIAHQQLLNNCKKLAKNNNSLAIIFSPHPVEFFTKTPFTTLTTPEERKKIILLFRAAY